MKTRIALAVALILMGQTPLAPFAVAQQQIVSSALTYSWPAVTQGAATGTVGSPIILDNLKAPRPGYYSISWTVSGTAPSACTFRTEWSNDGTTWVGADVTSPSTVSCTTSGAEQIAGKVSLYVRINLVSFTAGDNTTSVKFKYVGGPQAAQAGGVSATQYYPVAGTGPSSVGTVRIEVDGALFASGNFCSDLASAIALVGGHNAVINMRGDSSNCPAGSTNPFAGLSSGEVSLTVLLPCDHPVTTTVGWATGATSDLVVKGCGTGGNSGLFAASTFPSSTVLYQQGVSGGALLFGNRIEDLRLDCSTSANPSCQPYQSYAANERSGAFNIATKGQNSATATVPCIGIGDTNQTGLPGHASWVHVDANSCGANNGISVSADGADMLYFANITCNNTGFNTGLNCLDFQNPFGSGHTFLAGLQQEVHAEGYAYTVNYGPATRGDLQVADCTGTCTGVLSLNTTLGVTAHTLASVSSNVNLVNNTNANAVGDKVITNANSMSMVNEYVQAEPVNGVNRITALYGNIAHAGVFPPTILSGQTAALTGSVIASSAPAGIYRINGTLCVSTSATAGTISLTVQNPIGPFVSGTETHTAISNFSMTANGCNFFNDIVVYTATGNITFSTTFNSVTGSPAYGVAITLERLY